MTKQEKEQRKLDVLRCICKLPRSMINLHGTDNLTEFLLYELSRRTFFNFAKAAYFIENNDFKRFKGIAGYDGNEQKFMNDHWQKPDQFTQFTGASLFNQKVRSVDALHEKPASSLLVTEMAQALGFNRPLSCSWPVKYDNKGIFIFELYNDEEREIVDEHLEDTLHFFGFCPVF